MWVCKHRGSVRCSAFSKLLTFCKTLLTPTLMSQNCFKCEVKPRLGWRLGVAEHCALPSRPSFCVHIVAGSGQPSAVCPLRDGFRLPTSSDQWGSIKAWSSQPNSEQPWNATLARSRVSLGSGQSCSWAIISTHLPLPTPALFCLFYKSGVQGCTCTNILHTRLHFRICLPGKLNCHKW